MLRIHYIGCLLKLYPLLFVDFSASWGSRNFFFQQPFPCRIWKYPLLYYLVKSGSRYCQNTRRQSYPKLTFSVYCRIEYMSNQDPSGVIMSSYEHSRAIRSTQEQSWVWGNGTLSAHECSWHHDLELMNAHERLWMIILQWHHSHKCWWLLMSAHECSWAPMNTQDFGSIEPRALMSTNEWSWALLSTH